MLKIAINGYSGRMGQAIQSLAAEFSKQAEFIDFKNSASQTADLIIDFSNPSAFGGVLEYAVKNKLPLVTGTTGLSDEQKNSMEKAAGEIPILWDANMSLGVHWLLHALDAVKQLPNDFSLQVEEVHHKHKVDAPSGTAIEIQKVLQQNRSEILPSPISIRAGGVFGNHKVYMFGEEEVITIDHQVLSRKVFARGAVTASLWLAKQKPSFYRMKNLIQGAPA